MLIQITVMEPASDPASYGMSAYGMHINEYVGQYDGA